MKRSWIPGALLIAGAALYSAWGVLAQRNTAAPAPPPADPTITVRATFGYLRHGVKRYDGSVAASGGQVRNVSGWRFLRNDAVTGDSWKLEVRRMVFENQPERPNPVASQEPALNIVPAAVVVTADASASELQFTTAQGNFSVPLQRLQWGEPLTYLGGDVVVERVPRAAEIAATKTQDDYPSMTVTRRGEVWTAWQSYADGGDQVFVQRMGSAPQPLTGEKSDVFGTAVAEDAQGAIHVIWSERQGAAWHLYERVGQGSGWSAPRQVTRGSSPNMFHKLISGGGALYLIWVGYEGGQSYLYRASWSGGGWSAPERAGGPSVWAPDGAADAQGNLWLAWDGYAAGNYDVYLRRLPAGGGMDPVETVAGSPNFEAHPSVMIDTQGRPWVAYDQSGSNWGKDYSHDDPNRSTVLYANRMIRVVVKDGGEWKQAGDFSTAVSERLRRYWQLPKLAQDAAGRVWALFQIRTAATNQRDDFWASGGMWELYLTSFENGVWQPAAFVPDSSGRPEIPFDLLPAPRGVRLLWATDGKRFGAPQSLMDAFQFKYAVRTAEAVAPAPSGPPALSARDESRPRPQPSHPNEPEDVARIRAYRTTVGGATYRILRGDFHRHTEISGDGAGDGSVEDYYRYMLDAAQMDTGIIADHNAGNNNEYSWWRTEKSHDLFRIAGRYTPLFGYERSVPYPNGHRNVVFDHRGVRTLPMGQAEQQGKVNSGQIVYPYLRQHRGICMEHSLATDQGTDYRDNDPDLEPLVELYQGYHTSYEYKGAPRAENDTRHLKVHGGYQPAGFWWNALAKGLRLGVQASSDHISTHCSYAMIWTPDEDRGRIVENMRRRHAYAATDNIIVDFQADGHLMGEEYATTATPKLRIRVVGTDLIEQIDVVRNNEFLLTRRPLRKEFELDYADQSPRAGDNWYYVRVIQQDGNLAWSSPIWVRKQ